MFAPITRAEPQKSEFQPTIQSVGLRSAIPLLSVGASIFRAADPAINFLLRASASDLIHDLGRDLMRIHTHPGVLVLLAQIGTQHEHARDVTRRAIGKPPIIDPECIDDTRYILIRSG